MYKSEYKIENARYYVDSEDNEYISVTSLLSLYEDRTALINWKNRIGIEEAEKISLASRELGTNCHAEIEKYQTETEASFDYVHKFACPYAELAIKNFYSFVTVHSAEQAVFYNKNNIRYAGRYDSLVFLPENTFTYKKTEKHVKEGLYIVDLKTKRKPPRLDNVDFNLKHFLQLSAYNQVLSANLDIKGAIIVFVTNKKFNSVILSKENLKHYWNIYYQLCLDYFKLTELDKNKNWNYFVKQSNCLYDVELGELISNVPVEIILNIK